MNKKLNLDKIPQGIDILGGIDITGTFAEIFSSSHQMPGCLFLLCTRGECEINIHLDQYNMKKNSLIVIFPGVFFQIMSKSADCRFVFLSFSTELIHSSKLFSYTIEFTPFIFERPILQLDPKASNVLRDYMILFIRSKHLAPTLFNKEQALLAYTQLILGVGGIFKQRPKVKKRCFRNESIIKSLTRLILDDYKHERSITYYANKLHLTPQYLSTTIKVMTGKNLTNIISTLVIHDAKAKLKSTELSIQEIAESLNFADISSFGKYFKRYAGITPSQYRQSNE